MPLFLMFYPQEGFVSKNSVPISVPPRRFLLQHSTLFVFVSSCQPLRKAINDNSPKTGMEIMFVLMQTHCSNKVICAIHQPTLEHVLVDHCGTSQGTQVILLSDSGPSRWTACPPTVETVCRFFTMVFHQIRSKDHVGSCIISDVGIGRSYGSHSNLLYSERPTKYTTMQDEL